MTKYGLNRGGFFMKNLKKNDMRAHCFWENWRFFDETWTFEQCVFKRIDVFLIKYGCESSQFFVKIGKKRASYWLLWPIRWCSFDRIDVFWQIMGMRVGVFMKKFEKMTWERCVFKRMDVFFDKIWTWELFVYRKWTFFEKIWA